MKTTEFPRVLRIAAVTVMLASASLACNVGQAPEPTQPLVGVDGGGLPPDMTAYVATSTAMAGGGELPPAPTPVTPDPAAPTEGVVPDAPPANAEYEGISFYRDNALASGWTAETVPPPDTTEGAPIEWFLPSHYRFDFEGYQTTNQMAPPHIYVIPVANFENFNESGPAEISKLQTLLAEKPDLYSIPRDEALPLMPIFNAAQVIHAQPQYINFQNGTGVRYLTQYDQAVNLINNNLLFYTFQGLTNDGLYYIAITMPVAHADLPSGTEPYSDEQNAILAGEGYDEYIEGVIAMLNAADGGQFTPDLALLDQLVNSLTVAPTQ
jgi:hypothetical protein